MNKKVVMCFMLMLASLAVPIVCVAVKMRHGHNVLGSTVVAVFRTVPAPSAISCLAACSMTTDCEAANYVKDSGLCEFSNGLLRLGTQDGELYNLPSERRCFQSSCYWMMVDTLDFAGGKAYCESAGAHHVDTESEGEFIFVAIDLFEQPVFTELLNATNEDGIFLGATDFVEEGNYLWTDGSEVTAGFQAWGKDQPNWAVDHCVVMRRSDGWQWNDLNCNFHFMVLCEYELK